MKYVFSKTCFTQKTEDLKVYLNKIWGYRKK